MNADPNTSLSPKPKSLAFDKMKELDWIFQTTASICWIISVFLYGISSSGDWLQLFAASSWFVANISSLFKT